MWFGRYIAFSVRRVFYSFIYYKHYSFCSKRKRQKKKRKNRGNTQIKNRRGSSKET